MLLNLLKIVLCAYDIRYVWLYAYCKEVRDWPVV